MSRPSELSAAGGQGPEPEPVRTRKPRAGLQILFPKLTSAPNLVAWLRVKNRVIADAISRDELILD